MKKKLIIPVKEIDIPQNNLPRVITGTKSKIVENYAEEMADGIKFPSIKVWKNGGQQWVVWDGVHRLSAAKAAGMETIDCEVYEFPENEFLLQAFSANLKHGLPLKRREKVEVTRTLYQSGHSVPEIAEKTNIPERTLYRWLQPITEKEKQERNEKIKQMHEQCYTQEQIAEKIGITQQAVSSIIQEIANWQFFVLPENTANNDQITEKEKQERDKKIKQLHEQGYTQEEIAKEIGVTQTTVGRICKNDTCRFCILPENTANNDQSTEKEKQECSEKNRGLYEQEDTQSETSEMPGITKPDVGKIINSEDTQKNNQNLSLFKAELIQPPKSITYTPQVLQQNDNSHSAKPLKTITNNNQDFVSGNHLAPMENKKAYPENTTQDEKTKPEIHYKDMGYDQKFALSRMPLKDCVKKDILLSDLELGVIRVLELIKINWPIEKIQADVGLGFVEIRNAAVVMMAQHDNNLFYEKGKRWVANDLQMDWKDVDFIWSLRHFETALPTRFQLLRWIRESLHHNSDNSTQGFIRIETINQICIQKGVETPDQLTEEIKYDVLKKLPSEAKEHLQECSNRFHSLIEMFTYKRLNKEPFQELSEYYNQVVGMENGFRDFLIKNGKKVL